MPTEHFDVLIIGAGLSGIGAACHLKMQSPARTYAILESRDAIGGTWDLFRYPGIRSDSDMYTLGYIFRPWKQAKAIADGASILNYIRETADSYNVTGKIRFNHKVKRADWNSQTATWTVQAETGPGQEIRQFTCNFLFACCGYYDYAAGYTPDFAGREDFRGQIIHPQHWPADLDTKGKRIVVIGSGATAVTLVPALAETAAHVTMLQRSPTYIASRPSEDEFANRLRRHLPARLAYAITRWRNVGWQLLFYRMARRKPAAVKRQLIALVRGELGPDYDIATHFTPRYNPWDQRLCLVPDSDLFRAMRAGHASVVTDTIERFTQTGLRLHSGADLQADIIVTATGLKMQLLSFMEISIDGARIDLSKRMAYKGMMFGDVPNLATCFGYTNASWTLKADLTSAYVCRLLNHMSARGYHICTPKSDPAVAEAPFLDFTSGYVQRAIDHLPRQGTTAPWRVHQNYALDMLALRFGKLNDGTMTFSRRPQQQAA